MPPQYLNVFQAPSNTIPPSKDDTICRQHYTHIRLTNNSVKNDNYGAIVSANTFLWAVFRIGFLPHVFRV